MNGNVIVYKQMSCSYDTTLRNKDGVIKSYSKYSFPCTSGETIKIPVEKSMKSGALDFTCPTGRFDNSVSYSDGSGNMKYSGQCSYSAENHSNILKVPNTQRILVFLGIGVVIISIVVIIVLVVRKNK
jgi:hypothetical protein